MKDADSLAVAVASWCQPASSPAVPVLQQLPDLQAVSGGIVAAAQRRLPSSCLICAAFRACRLRARGREKKSEEC